MVATTRRPDATRCATADSAPRRLSTSTKLAVAPFGGRPDEDDRHPGCGQPGGEGVVAVEAHQKGAIDVAGREVVGGAPLIGLGFGDEEDQLSVAGGELGADAAQEAREERVA